MKKKIATVAAVAGLAAAGFAGTAEAKGKPAGIACQQAGIAYLQDNDLLAAVAKNGLAVSTAVSLGVEPRSALPEGVGLDTVLSLSTVLADHRAGDNSIFTYPWC